MAADWSVRIHTPAWQRLAGLSAHADALAALSEITSLAQAPSMWPMPPGLALVIANIRSTRAAPRVCPTSRAVARTPFRTSIDTRKWHAARYRQGTGVDEQGGWFRPPELA